MLSLNMLSLKVLSFPSRGPAVVFGLTLAEPNWMSRETTAVPEISFSAPSLSCRYTREAIELARKWLGTESTLEYGAGTDGARITAAELILKPTVVLNADRI